VTWREQKLRRRVRALTGYAQVLLAHGQFVEEAEDILEMRIRDAQVRGQTHLHVIVGRRNHCHCHVQKIKPHVEEVCRLLGLDFATEASEGRIYVDLTGGKVGTAPPLPQQPNGYQGGYASGGGGGGGGYNHSPNAGYPASGYQGGHQRQQQHQQQQQPQNDVEKLLLGCVCCVRCCVVM
jgi:hypothetical protein